MRYLRGAGKAALLLHLAQRPSERPLVRIVVVEGNSMEPVVHSGQLLIFARLPWDVQDIVLADVDEELLVVKRVASCGEDRVLLAGENGNASQNYIVSRHKVIGRLICNTGLCPPSWLYVTAQQQAQEKPGELPLNSASPPGHGSSSERGLARSWWTMSAHRVQQQQ